MDHIDNIDKLQVLLLINHLNSFTGNFPHTDTGLIKLVLFCFEYWNIIISAIDAPGVFLFEWWSVFWDIFIARTNEKHSEVAASYIEVGLTFFVSANGIIFDSFLGCDWLNCSVL